MEAMDIQAVESKLSDVTVTAIPMSGKNAHKDLGPAGNSHTTISTVPASSPSSVGKDKDGTSKYAQLLAVIEEMGTMGDVTWTTRYRLLQPYNADSVEWCPVEPYHHVLVCGTYQLDKSDRDKEDQPTGTEQPKNQKRLGRINLYTVDQNGQPTLHHAVDTAGILDQKWCYHRIHGFPILAVVTSVGNLTLFKLRENEDKKLKLEQWLEHSIGENILALSLDWSTNKSDSEHKIVVSASSGAVTVLRLAGDALEELEYCKSHGFEAWIAAFNYWSPKIFYSGGDDCVFKSYDTRMPDMAVTSNRSHGAGVTAIKSHIDVEHQLLTGSYDEIVRLWDARSLKCCITETNVNGGVWRLKWHPYKNNIILAACMYGGFRLLKSDEEFNVISEYMEHESIAYGADWQFSERPLVATCSFYDCKMHISEVIV